jgi:hypothetical protein
MAKEDLRSTQRHCIDEIKRKSMHLNPQMKMFNNDIAFNDEGSLQKLYTKLEIFEEEVLGRQKEILRAYVGLQKENAKLAKRSNELVSQTSLEMQLQTLKSLV